MSVQAPPKEGGGGGRLSNSAPLLIIMFILSAVFVLLAMGRNPWNDLFIDPLINALVLLNVVVLGQFGLAIILFTVLLRLATLPFTIRQFQSMKEMQAAQPKIQELNKKYKDPKRRQEEMIKLYREHNINPLGCVMPMVIQMSVFIALYRALVFVVGGSPESLIGLSERLYSFNLLQGQIPLEQTFLWLDLGQRDGTLILPLMVGLSTYVQQKMTMTPNASPEMQQQQQMMAWMMPMMLTFFTLSLPSGVGIYWVISNIFSLFASYFVYGRRLLSWRQLLPIPAPAATSAASKKAEGGDQAGDDSADDADEATASEEESDSEEPASAPAPRTRRRYGKRRGKRKNRR
ncbi:MAG: membrane protein insertase YidC [Chloroflexi bacterium]|nr:membrane protein insertase YidC [Chloroflexota bacterium]